MMKSQNYQFEIHYCNSTERQEKKLSDCHNITEIQEYIQDIQINLWAAQFEIDYHTYDKRPLYINQQILKTTLLSPNEIQRSQISLIQNTYETQDHFFQLGEISFEGEFYKVADIVYRPLYKGVWGNIIYSDQIYLKPRQTIHSR